MNWKYKLWQVMDLIVDFLPHKTGEELIKEGNLVNTKILSNGEVGYKINYRGYRACKLLNQKKGDDLNEGRRI